ncbi:DUF547 domain-containing protein [Hymenobacter glaciei]|uniref:DUF547 domain-containing protein n=1 Tax=Hymenobacter glaciei TaxID=877209 RepID=UPI0031EDE666
MIRSSRLLVLVCLLLLGSGSFWGCGYIRYLIPLNPTAATATTPPTHAGWNTIVKQYVNQQGLVNYRGLRTDSLALNAYIQDLGSHMPSKSWTDNDRLAYWINAYNAYTVQLIVRNYPVKSIKDLGGDKIFVNTPWDKHFIHLGGQAYSLNDIEHRIIRKQFKDNRIHLALVCAAMSCPRLRNEAYTGPSLTAQLDDQGRDFLNNPAKNKLTPIDKPQVSAIFSFYPKDFTKNGSKSVQEFVNRYATTKINPSATLRYLTYNWALNEQ